MFGVLDVLKSILCVLEHITTYVADAVVWVVNLIIAALGALVDGLIAILPGMPGFPSPPDTGGWLWLNYFVPVGGLVVLIGSAVALVVAVLVIRVALNWAKAL